MDTTMALEVIGGPMDGLRTCIRDTRSPVLIGRQVGNHLTLPFDMTISRWHASVTREGKDSYLTDEKSLSGTWFEGSKVDKIKLKPGMILLVGGTMVEISEIPASQGGVLLEDGFFNDPLEVYDFTAPLKQIWDRLQQKTSYIDISHIFQQPEFYRPKQLDAFEGIKRLLSPDFKKNMFFGSGPCNVYPKYRFFHKDQRITPPRVWAILDMASDANTKPVDIQGFIEAVLNEKKSPAARVLNGDVAFVEGASNRFQAPPKAAPDPPKEVDPFKKILAGSFLRIERIISGFIEDAVSAGFAKGTPARPDQDLDFETALNTTQQADLNNRVKRLEKNLVAVLAAHRDAVTLFEKELGHRINGAIDHGDHKGLFPPRSNSSASVSAAVKRVLKEAELEGLAENIVRKTIKNKVIS